MLLFHICLEGSEEAGLFGNEDGATIDPEAEEEVRHVSVHAHNADLVLDMRRMRKYGGRRAPDEQDEWASCVIS